MGTPMGTVPGTVLTASAHLGFHSPQCRPEPGISARTWHFRPRLLHRCPHTLVGWVHRHARALTRCSDPCGYCSLFDRHCRRPCRCNAGLRALRVCTVARRVCAQNVPRACSTRMRRCRVTRQSYHPSRPSSAVYAAANADRNKFRSALAHAATIPRHQAGWEPCQQLHGTLPGGAGHHGGAARDEQHRQRGCRAAGRARRHMERGSTWHVSSPSQVGSTASGAGSWRSSWSGWLTGSQLPCTGRVRNPGPPGRPRCPRCTGCGGGTRAARRRRPLCSTPARYHTRIWLRVTAGAARLQKCRCGCRCRARKTLVGLPWACCCSRAAPFGKETRGLRAAGCSPTGVGVRRRPVACVRVVSSALPCAQPAPPLAAPTCRRRV